MNIYKLQDEKCKLIQELINQRKEFEEDDLTYKRITERIRYNSGYLDALYDIELILTRFIWGTK